jgi:uncharacterized protein (DUF1800 family)
MSDARAMAVTALRRFGLGARPGEIATMAGDPRGYVRAALDAPDAVRLDDPDLDPSHLAFANVRLAELQRRQVRESAQDALRQQTGVPYPATGGAKPSEMPSRQGFARPGLMRGEVYQDEAAVRLDRLVTTTHPFLERLVMFWSNHFCISATKGQVRALAGGYEREAIRPHVLGRFTDMLLAVEQHPAMLIYLDNQLSFGPNSRAGINQKKGLNENLAREILELHTLGVDGGYTQADVTNLARLITGWTVGNLQRGEEAGKFTYLPQRREPGTFAVLGKTYGDPTAEAGRQALRDLAAHPATALHIATKFARHFVSDPPPPALVEALRASFMRTGGDLAALARTLVDTDAAWTEPARKILPPNDFLVALLRGFPIPQRPRSAEIVRLSNQLGQPLWSVPSPKGWPESNEAWAAPAPIRERLRIAETMSRQVDRAADPRALAEDLLGPALRVETREAIARAETREQGFTLIAMSPEFQRR